jgi:hypothetical protein
MRLEFGALCGGDEILAHLAGSWTSRSPAGFGAPAIRGITPAVERQRRIICRKF